MRKKSSKNKNDKSNAHQLYFVRVVTFKVT